MTDSTQQLDLLRNASLVLGMINVLQPVSYDHLLTRVGPKRATSLRDILRFLAHRDLIRELPHDRFRCTWVGQSAMWSEALQTSRDVQRMWRLSDLSDEYRRGNGEGDLPQ